MALDRSPAPRPPTPRSVAPAPGGASPREISPRLREIYSQASRLFVERGYEATSMSDIAEAVKITKAGLYHFVTGKEDLLYTIMSFGMDELEDEVVQPARKVADPAARLDFIVRAHLENISRGVGPHGNAVTLVVDEPWGLGAERRAAIDGRKRAYFQLVRDTLEALKASGRARPDLDAAIAAHSIIGMILWTARWRRPEGRLSLDLIVEQITALAKRGVGGSD